MSRLLDDVDIINQRLKDRIDRLEKDLAKATDSNANLHDNLAKCREEVKALKEIERQYKILKEDHNSCIKTLTEISIGNLSDPVQYAKRKLDDLSE